MSDEKKKKKTKQPLIVPTFLQNRATNKIDSKVRLFGKKILILLSFAVCSTLLFIVCVKVRIKVEELGRDGSKRVDLRGRECERDAG